MRYSDISHVNDWVLAYCRADLDHTNPWRQLMPETERAPMTVADIIGVIRERFGEAAARSVRITVH